MSDENFKLYEAHSRDLNEVHIRERGFVNLISVNWILTFVVPFPFRTSSLCPCSREIWIEPFWRRVFCPIRTQNINGKSDCLSIDRGVSCEWMSASNQYHDNWNGVIGFVQGLSWCLCLVHSPLTKLQQSLRRFAASLHSDCFDCSFLKKKYKRCYCCVILSALSVEASCICTRAVFVRNECVESCWRCWVRVSVTSSSSFLSACLLHSHFFQSDHLNSSFNCCAS